MWQNLSEDTWHDLLKVVMSITDALLTVTSTMADELCPHLLRVLDELWVRSHVLNVDMWAMLSQYFRRWVHRLPTVQQWNTTNLGLTRRVLNALYGSIEGSSTDIFVAMYSKPKASPKRELNVFIAGRRDKRQESTSPTQNLSFWRGTAFSTSWAIRRRSSRPCFQRRCRASPV